MNVVIFLFDLRPWTSSSLAETKWERTDFNLKPFTFQFTIDIDWKQLSSSAGFWLNSKMHKFYRLKYIVNHRNLTMRDHHYCWLSSKLQVGNYKVSFNVVERLKISEISLFTEISFYYKIFLSFTEFIFYTLE